MMMMIGVDKRSVSVGGGPKMPIRSNPRSHNQGPIPSVHVLGLLGYRFGRVTVFSGGLFRVVHLHYQPKSKNKNKKTESKSGEKAMCLI